VTIVLVGLNHRTATVDVRERYSLTDEGQYRILRQIIGSGDAGIRECAIISTCNRLEIYAVGDDPERMDARLRALVNALDPLPDDLLYTRTNSEAVRHLMRVAAGLDSLILGEPQILGQVADALRFSQSASAAGPTLSGLFSRAIHAGKRARTETDIARYTVSVAHAAALLAVNATAEIHERRVLIVGAGEMAEMATRALQSHGATHLQIMSRTYTHAADTAGRLGAEALEWSQLGHALAQADIVISATRAPHTVILSEDVTPALTTDRTAPLVCVDIAVPRDIDSAVAHLPGVQLYDIDDLNLVIDQHRAQRQAAAARVEEIVIEEVDTFIEWLSGRQVAPVIVDLRRKAEAIAAAEVEQALRRLGDLDHREQAIVEQMAQRIVNKILHQPTLSLRSHAGTPEGSDYAETVRELFALEQPAPVQESVVHGAAR
jgi:glutamyl-tRNA reductase